jgi:NAD(P)-dependent dehydrogenase (short-subunit alcohol dehydrogenase family)
MTNPLAGTVALVAGATRGAGRGIAVELGAAGATVYCTGRSTRAAGSAVAGAGGTVRHDRPETIEDTADLVTAAGGTGIAVPTDHLVPEQVARLVARIDADHGRLDVVVHDIFGGDYLATWDTPVWEHDLADGLHLLRLAVDTHLVTARYAFPLLIRRPGGLVVEITDGTAAYNAEHYRLNVYYDLAKVAPIRLARSWAHELGPHGATAVAVTPGWLRSEVMLDEFGVTEDNWRDACADQPHFAISESPRLVGRGIAALAADPDRARWQGGSTSSGELARVYGLTDLDGSAPDAWRYVVAVQDAGRPADTTGYR